MRKSLTRPLLNTPWLFGYIAGVTMLFCIFHFLNPASKMTEFDMYVILFLMLISGTILFAVPFVEIMQDRRAKFYFEFPVAGLAGIIEAVVSLIALTTGDRTLYDSFNLIGLLVLFGAVLISVSARFIYGTK